MDLVSRKWIDTLLVPRGRGESIHVQAIYTRALEAEGLLEGIEARMIEPNTDELLPVLLAVLRQWPADNLRDHQRVHGPARARAAHRPAPHPDQAHIESFFGHVKHDWPHLEQIRDPGGLATELDRVRHDYNTIRLHAGIGYVTPDDEHEGRGPQIRKARREGMRKARADRIAYRRQRPSTGPDPDGEFLRPSVQKTQTHLSPDHFGASRLRLLWLQHVRYIPTK